MSCFCSAGLKSGVLADNIKFSNIGEIIYLSDKL